MAVILETSLGDITVDLYTDERPKCSENFLKLCKTKYYNWSLFHSVQRNLVAQTGDPTSTGRGGASIYAKLYGDQATYFDAEIKPRIKHKKKGTLSMVNNGSNMHGSQFFITLASDIDYLDGDHTVFGEVAEGFETLDKINEVYVDQDSRPYKDIRIYHTVVLEDPYDDPDALEEYIPPASPTLTKEQLESDRIGAEEDIDPSKGKTEEEINEELNTKEAKANAQLLEMVGDLPDAEVNPEDNVLFVCKLNPVTTSEDLEIIFSRFGTILSCEVIKDQKTEESLQYAFIEFENSQECENAYFKMDNVLIDDRRIHVDFSQSVAKLKYKHGKGRTVDVNNQYVIRDEKIRRDGYDLVFSDDESSSKNSKKQKKQKKSKHNDQHWDSDEKKQRKDHNTRKSRSRSPVQRRRSPYLKDRRRKSQSPVRKDRRSPSPVRKNRRSPSPVRRNRRFPSPVRKHRRSPSPVHRNRRSPSPVRRNRRSPSPVRRNRRSPSPVRRNRRSPSPDRRKRRSPSPVRRNRRSPSPVDRSTSPKHKKRDREKRNEKFSRSEQKERKSRDRSISKEREHKKHKKDKYR